MKLSPEETLAVNAVIQAEKRPENTPVPVPGLHQEADGSLVVRKHDGSLALRMAN